jgi:ribosomal protein S18 acetylase RimI-like enzyme
MKTQFKIEQATESDWPWIVQGEVEIAWVRLSAEQQKHVGRQAVEGAVARRVRRLREAQDFATVAFVARADDGTLSGFVWVAKDQNDSTGQLQASLLNQYVAEPYRNQGLGHRLLETAEEWARQQGQPRIYISIGARNTLGQKLYESLGYRVETLRMAKQLSPCEPDDVDALSSGVCEKNNA